MVFMYDIVMTKRIFVKKNQRNHCSKMREQKSFRRNIGRGELDE